MALKTFAALLALYCKLELWDNQQQDNSRVLLYTMHMDSV